MKTRFAIVGSERLPPAPKLCGQCPLCGDEVIAKCGAVKAWHWSHKARLQCDPWWENETAWHREWKDRFPVDCQEIVLFDPITGEKHIADVRTRHGQVVEFQHSVMPPGELKARENFYQNMVWIVDGKRGELDADYFRLSRSNGPVARDPQIYDLWWLGKSRLFANWSTATTQVYIDFGEKVIWRLLRYDAQTKEGKLGPVPREWVVEALLAGQPIRGMA